ncbi:hypothetical protein Lal_00032281 [Lupinus albus]|nr:hypothetical protein Lal_00032281 [Lupinus albus]
MERVGPFSNSKRRDPNNLNEFLTFMRALAKKIASSSPFSQNSPHFRNLTVSTHSLSPRRAISPKRGSQGVTLLLAANYLNVKDVIDFLCQTVANLIPNKSVKFVRNFFGVVNDYTAAEEAEIRQTHAWYRKQLDLISSITMFEVVVIAMANGEAVKCCTLDGESSIAESITSLCSDPSSMGHVKSRQILLYIQVWKH